VTQSIDRRKLLRFAAATGAGLLASAAGRALAAEPRKSAGAAAEPVPSPAEDLMHEHGLLERVLLIYEESSRRMGAREQPVQPEIIRDAAQLVRTYIEDHHEKLEERYIFPRFERSTTKEHADLVKVLREQHGAGRKLTDRILKLSGTKLDDPVNRTQMQATLQDFVRMQRPHESREDTVLFPAFRKLVSPGEYRQLGAEIRKSEQRTPAGGLDMMVEKVSSLERQLGVYDLSKFTPKA
jgi:hemerythrin-like domain-containing protein